jgi:hypothetical protein
LHLVATRAVCRHSTRFATAVVDNAVEFGSQHVGWIRRIPSRTVLLRDWNASYPLHILSKVQFRRLVQVVAPAGLDMSLVVSVLGVPLMDCNCTTTTDDTVSSSLVVVPAVVSVASDASQSACSPSTVEAARSVGC